MSRPPARRGRGRRLPWLLPLLVLGCAPGPAGGSAPGADGAGRLHALLLNGGDRREINYWSHLRHLEVLVELLREGGVDPSRITVFSSDGDDPSPDLAERALAPHADAWLLPASEAGRWLRPGVAYVDSRLEGFGLRPARRDALRQWFDEQGAALGPGDVLLFYVTDHGNKNAADLANNTISLWGERLSVVELRELLGRLDPGVRVILVMGQCFSGSFAHAISGEDGAPPAGNVCGYFATTADRRAHGCYPESFREEGVGYSHSLFEGLRRRGRLPDAQRDAVVHDRTPDVPHATSDFYLAELVARRAAASERTADALVDELLARAWREPARYEADIRLLDELARSFGLFSPRSLAELDGASQGLPELEEQLETYAERWRQTLEALKEENLERFLEAHPAWRERLQAGALAALDASARQATAAELLGELVPFSRGDPARHARLERLRRQWRDAQRARDRTQVRLGVVLRMRTLLTSLAGRVLLEGGGAEEERAAVGRLAACEDLALPGLPLATAAAAPESFPPLAEDRRLIESVMPGWMGIRYRPASDVLRSGYGLERGAVVILEVSPGGPSERAGLRPGDLVLGPPGAPFREPHQVREWIMLREVGQETRIEVLRDGERRQLALEPQPYPLALPALPGPPSLGSPAPALELAFFRGAAELEPGEPRLLFFFASWCVHCKQALPEVLAFAEQRGVEVVAISDEQPDELAAFFAGFQGAFPRVVASDPGRGAFRRYGVSGTPTFALLDAQGVLRHYQTGYRAGEGLGVEGWRFDPAAR